jgi:hypothetical protein
MSTSPKRLPLSRANIVMLSCLVAAAIVTAVFHNILGTVVLIVIAVGGLISALVARRPNASDSLRINALEYRDERDAQLARRAFAVVGAVALSLTLFEVVVANLLLTWFLQTPIVGLVVNSIVCLQLLVLCVVWAAANSWAVRRG